MRYALVVLGIAGCIGLGIGLHRGWFSRAYDQATTAALTEDARLAIDVRCQGEDTRASRECRATLKRLYLSGSLDPDRTLRTWCQEFKTARWGGSRPAPPEVCVQRYGGWQEG
jgi:hypothetical protein